ncbi:MAG: citramalate synthase [Deltaproteobacteria bacterium]|nr:MAG: citramalate synthase [Deltaproteobacteria bacterium]
MRKIEIYDTTLRDGTQAEDFNLSLEDKIRCSKKLDELGIHYIEGGWPGSNPKDVAYFKEIKNYELKTSKVAAFGSTHNPRASAEKDRNLGALLKAKTEVITIFGKSWTVHVRDALRTTLERNVEIIRDSLAYVRPKIWKLIYDAEHFFDGFKSDPEYALATLKAALEGGADCLVLCDTNGGTLTTDLQKIIKRVKKEFPKAELGIHTHNDSELAVANSLAAVQLGANQVQGTMNGVGERCGNANLCSIIPAIKLKLKMDCITDEQLARLRETSRYILELANVRPFRYQPYVGRSAFAHKGGIHVAAVERNPETYEHIYPELVGNRRRVLVSDLSGRSTIKQKAEQYGIEISTKDPVAMQVLEELKQLEHEGFQYEAAEGSFELLLNQALGRVKRYFELVGFRVLVSKTDETQPSESEATVMVKVGGKVEHTAATGVGPVNALDNALRKALEKFYPELAHMRLNDYKVRVLPGKEGTAAKVRVLIESVDKDNIWGTVGVSENILEASWLALVDSINYKMFKDEKGHKK